MIKKHQSGYTILEVLVAAIILMSSLLGMGALQSTAMKKNTSAMNKTQVMEASRYIADALRSQVSTKGNNNLGVDPNYNGFRADFRGANHQADYIEDCGSGCDRQTMTAHMLAEWERMIGENLPQGKGTIQQVIENKLVDGQNQQTTYYRITIMWDDRQMAQNSDGTVAQLLEDCSGNPKVSLTCNTIIVQP